MKCGQNQRTSHSNRDGRDTDVEISSPALVAVGDGSSDTLVQIFALDCASGGRAKRFGEFLLDGLHESCSKARSSDTIARLR